MTATLQEVAAGVYAYVQPGGGWCVNNAGLVRGDATTVLVDTAATQERSARLRDAVLAVAGRPPGLLVNTHHHGDHVFGNAAFLPEATVVAHAELPAELAAAGTGLRALWPDVSWGETPLVAPHLTFRDRITLHPGGSDTGEVELLHVGPAHTTNDVVAWLPGPRVLFAGDVVMSGVAPYCLMGSVTGSLRALRRLRALDPAVVVPGHGPVGGPELIDATERYLRWVDALAADGVRAGAGALDVARSADPGEFARLGEGERLVGNLHRAYAEHAGTPPGSPIDVASSFAEMVAFHGSLPTCHA